MNTASVLLPVYNAQRSLEATVAEILEVLSQWTGHFELAILDDGSTDETAEVARELAACYPQVRVIRHPLRLGLAEAIQTGFDHMPGEIILAGDEDYRLDSDDLRTLSQLRDAEWCTSGQHARPQAGEPWMEKLLATKPRAADARRGFQPLSRQAFERFRTRQAADMMRRVETPQHDCTTAIARRLGHPKYLKIAGYFAEDN